MTVVPDEQHRQDALALDRHRSGDRSAFRELFDRHQPAVFAFCARHSGLGRDQVVDLVQDVFVQAHKNLNALRQPERLRGWLLTIARNLIVSRARAARTEANALREAQRTLDAPAPEPVWDESLFLVLEQALTHEADRATRDIVTAYYGDARVTTQEISDSLGIPKGTVTVKLQRFRQRLHRKLLAHLAPQVEQP